MSAFVIGPTTRGAGASGVTGGNLVGFDGGRPLLGDQHAFFVAEFGEDDREAKRAALLAGLLVPVLHPGAGPQRLPGARQRAVKDVLLPAVERPVAAEAQVET